MLHFQFGAGIIPYHLHIYVLPLRRLASYKMAEDASFVTLQTCTQPLYSTPVGIL